MGQASVNKVPSIELNSGHYIPAVGLGLFGVGDGAATQAVQSAVDLGYRHIDSARVYGNEADTGKGIAAALDSGKVAREDLYIVSKIAPTSEQMSFEGVEQATHACLKDLQLDYLDLMLIHWPVHSDRPEDKVDPPLSETWKGLEACVEKGLIRSIGISNFSTKKAEELLKDVRIKPAVLQVESHPNWRNDKTLDWCKQHGIHMTAYSPFGSPGQMESMGTNLPTALENKVVKDIAAKNNTSPATVLMAWHMQRGSSAIPKTADVTRQEENIEGASFKLSSGDIKAISQLPQTKYFKGDGPFFGNERPWKTYQDLWDEPEINELQ